MKQIYETEDTGKILMICYQCEKTIWPWESKDWTLQGSGWAQWEVSHKRCVRFTKERSNEGEKNGR